MPMTRWQTELAGSAALVLALSGAPHAQNIVIKLATVVPEGSIWDKNVRQMGDEWKAATGDRVSVTVFSGGSQGDESTVLRKMRLDALQAAAFTAGGLGSIDAWCNGSRPTASSHAPWR